MNHDGHSNTSLYGGIIGNLMLTRRQKSRLSEPLSIKTAGLDTSYSLFLIVDFGSDELASGIDYRTLLTRAVSTSPRANKSDFSDTCGL